MEASELFSNDTPTVIVPLLFYAKEAYSIFQGKTWMIKVFHLSSAAFRLPREDLITGTLTQAST